MTGTGIAGFFIHNWRPDQQVPAAAVVVRHLAVAVGADDPVRLSLSGEHRPDIGVATGTVRVAMTVNCIGRDGRIDKVVVTVVHVHLIDTRQRIDNIQC